MALLKAFELTFPLSSHSPQSAPSVCVVTCSSHPPVFCSPRGEPAFLQTPCLVLAWSQSNSSQLVLKVAGHHCAMDDSMQMNSVEPYVELFCICIILHLCVWCCICTSFFSRCSSSLSRVLSATAKSFSCLLSIARASASALLLSASARPLSASSAALEHSVALCWLRYSFCFS